MIIYETMSTMINIKLLWNIYESLWHLQQLQDLQGFPGFADAGEIVLKGPVLVLGPFSDGPRTGPVPKISVIIKIGWELNKLWYISWTSKIWHATFVVFTFFFFLNQFLSDLDEKKIKIYLK